MRQHLWLNGHVKVYKKMLKSLAVKTCRNLSNTVALFLKFGNICFRGAGLNTNHALRPNSIARNWRTFLLLTVWGCLHSLLT